MNIEPTEDRILIRPDQAPETSPGGIILLEDAREQKLEGEVLAVGPGIMDDLGKVRRPLFKVGDRVMFAKYAGTEVDVDGQTCVLVRAPDILALVS